MSGQTDVGTNRQRDRRTDRWMNGQTDIMTDRWMNGQTDIRTDGQTNGQTDTLMNEWIYRKTNGLTDRQKWTDRQTGRN